MHRPHLLPHALLAAALALPACRGTLTVAGYTSADDDDDAGDPDDRDGDGDPSDTDCDDEDSSAFHGNDEVCGDPVDNDCDPATLCYGVTVGPNTAWITPFVSEQRAADWYFGSNGAPPFSASDHLSVGLHQQSDGPLSLVFVLDAIEDGSGGRARVTVRGVEGAELLVSDDPGEGFVDGGIGRVDLGWVECCVDGAGLGPQPPHQCVELEVSDEDNLDRFEAADPTGSQVVGPTFDWLELCASQ